MVCWLRQQFVLHDAELASSRGCRRYLTTPELEAMLAAPDQATWHGELYLPKAWTDDRDRCRAAGIADDVPFATKPELAWQMIGRAADAGGAH